MRQSNNVCHNKCRFVVALHSNKQYTLIIHINNIYMHSFVYMYLYSSNGVATVAS